MPPILWKELIYEIKSSLGRYLSILAIVALGVSFFAGIKASPPDMKNSADAYFDKYVMQDIQLYSTIGLNEEDVDAIKTIPNVEQVQGMFSADYLAKEENRELTIKLFSFEPNQKINTPRLVEGRFPTQPNECLYQAPAANAKLMGTKEIGQTITLYSGTETPIDEDLSVTTFTIVGKAYNPNYLSYDLGSSAIGSGTVDSFIYVLQDVIKADYFTEIDLTVNGAKEKDSYDQSYFDLVSPVVSAVEKLADSQIEKDVQAKWNLIDRNERSANQKLDEAKAQIDEAAIQLENGQAMLLSQEQALQEGWNQWEEGKRQLEDGKNQLAQGKQQLEDGISQIDNAVVQIKSGQAMLSQLEEQKKQVQMAILAAQALEQVQNSLITTSSSLEEVNQQIAALEADGQPSSLLQIVPLRAQSAILKTRKEQLIGQITGNPYSSLEEAVQKVEVQKVEMLSQLGGSIASATAMMAQIENGIQQINEGVASLPQLEQTQKELLSQKEALKDAEREIADKQNLIDETFQTLQNGQEQIDQARDELENGRLEYEQGVATYEKQKQDAADRFAEAREMIQTLEPKWIVLDRNSHYSYRDYESCADRMDGIASVFPAFFFLVAALVCMTTMTRMVDENRNEMGTLKALGYSRFQIAAKYLIYAGSASILGSLVGSAIGMVIFPWIIYTTWNIMYTLEEIHFRFQPWLMLSASGIVTFVVLLATYFSIYKEMREVPAQLMRPKAAKAGQRILLERIPWFWSKLSFMHKVTLRNLFRYKKRFFMTVLGIAGCCALLVSGFGLNDSISDIVPRQFQAIYHYDASISARSKNKEETVKQIQQINGVKDAFDLEMMAITVNYDDKDVAGFLNIVSDPSAFETFMTFIPMGSDSDKELTNKGALISVKTAEKMKVKVGDRISFKTTNEEEASVVVAGIFEQYISHQIYVTKELFDTLGIKEKPDANILLVAESTDPEFQSVLGSQIMDIDDVRSVTFYSNTINNFLDMISSIKLVVVVLVLSAAMLAFVVLYNLCNVNISERMREIATIKVLGFTEKEVNAYVNRETIILALIGSIVGLFMGIYLHNMIMNLAEMDTVRFGRTIVWQSYAYSIGLTMLFTFMVNWIMKFQLRKIEMVESLKAVE